MNNIAPLLPQLKPTSQSPETTGASRGSETGFGKIFNKTLSQRQQPLDKDPAAKSEAAAGSARTHNGKPLERTEPNATTSRPEPEQPSAEDEQTPATDAAAPVAMSTETFSSEIEEAENTAASPTGGIPGAAVSPQTGSADIQTGSFKGGPADSVVSLKQDGLVGNAGSEPLEAALQAIQTAAEKKSDQAATPFGPNQAARSSKADQAVMPMNHDLPAEVTPRKFPAAATPAKTPAGEVAGNNNAIAHPGGKKDNAAAATGSPLGDRNAGMPAAQTTQTPLAAGHQTTALSNGYAARPAVNAGETAIVISVAGEDSLTAVSTPAGQPPLWPASGANHGDTPITISGYFASAKPQPAAVTAAKAQSAISDASLADKTQGIGTSAEEATIPALKAAPVPGLGHLGSLAEKSPLHIADAVATTTLSDTGNRQSSETAPLIASLQELTTLKKPGQQSHEGLRQTEEPLRQQFRELALEQKSETRGNDGGSQQQTGKQESPTGGQPQSFSPWTTTAPASDQPQGFSQLSQAAPTHGTLAQHTAPTDQHQPAPATAPTPPMQDDQFFFQVAERFQLQMRNQQTRLNIQLHPADLGKLDISLSVKEGSIRAHVVAQSGQVRELLERNMTRLRGILESQGFSIEEILVSARSEVIDNSDLFQEQPAWRTPPAGLESQNSDTHFDETLESLVLGSGSATTGVNITA